MTNNYTIFQDNHKLFRKYVLRPMSDSQEYKDISQQFDSILLLADRILCAFVENIEFSQIEKINAHLVNIARAEENQEDYSRFVDALLGASEQWLKPILWLVYPNSWAKLNQNKKHFTLFPTIRELNLLTQAELDMPERESHRITDEIRQLIYWNRKDRNYITHETQEAPAYIRGRFLTVALVTLLAPVYKHQDAIKSRLLDLVASPFQNKEIEDLLALVNSERVKHLERFRAREGWITDLQTRLSHGSQISKPYLLLIGYEGIGKSAICAKLTEILSKGAAYGRYAGGVKKTAPWLPHVLLHFGKQSNQPNEIVRSLIAQANTLLLRPTPLPEANDYIVSELETESSRDAVLAKLEPRRPYKSASSDNTPLPNTSRGYKSIGQGGLSRRRHKVAASELILYRRALYLVLEKVARERGPIVLIIDAIDEITTGGGELEFLPETLPTGVSALLTGRQNTKALDWLITNREVDRIRLTGLDKDEVPLLTQINSLDGTAEANFNERVLKASQGWPVLVLAAARSARSQRDNLDAVQVDRSVDSVFARQASEWNAGSLDSPDLLRDLLLLLAIFEPVAPLDLELIQSFLDYQNIHLSLADLRQELLPVGAQLEGLSVGRLKLGLKAFADYVRNRYCSKRDLNGALETIISWLITEGEIDAKVLSPFLKFWADPDQIKDKNILATVERLVDSLQSSSTPNMLYEIYLFSQQKRLRKDALLPFAVRLLFAAAELGEPRAMFAVGWRLFEGVGVEKDTSEGERWLRRAAAASHLNAVTYLALHLLDGAGMKKNTEEGEALLHQAADSGDVNALFLLAERLLDGRGIEKNVIEGEQILRKLVDDGEHFAARILALRLISGSSLAQNLEEGEQLLRKLADDDVTAAITLAEFLMDGVLPPQRSEEGHALLRKYADSGNKDAKGTLATRLIEGDGLVQDIEEGEQLLRELVNEGDSQATHILGYYLIEGEQLPKNVQEGEQWLIKASESGRVDAMIELGVRYLDGIGLTKKKIEGLKWLRKAAETGNAKAMRTLGQYILKDNTLVRDKKEGKLWLQKAANVGDASAMTSLGIRLFKGDGIDVNTKEGEQWLRKAIEAGDARAMGSLGTRLCEGNGVPQNKQEGMQLLEKSCSLGDSYGAHHLALEYYKLHNFSEAARTFLLAFQYGDKLESGIDLVYMARRSELPPDLELPSIPTLLEKSLEERNPFAIINYALCLATGYCYPQDWHAADQAIASLVNLETGRIAVASDWWHKEIIPPDDPEGYLVIGWLVRHRLIRDPDGMSIAQRMAYARKHGWILPDWMDYDASSRKSN